MKALRQHLAILGGSLAVLWIVYGLEVLSGGALQRYGVRPLDTDAFSGILFAPFLHGSQAHLIANSLSFAVLGWLVLLRGTRHFVWVSLIATLTGGLTAWLLGMPGSVHIGASGVIFGYFGFLMLGGLFERRVWPILLSIGVTVAWGGLVFGVLPGQPGISWQEHFGGFIGGALAAKWLATPGARAAAPRRR